MKDKMVVEFFWENVSLFFFGQFFWAPLLVEVEGMKG